MELCLNGALEKSNPNNCIILGFFEGHSDNNFQHLITEMHEMFLKPGKAICILQPSACGVILINCGKPENYTKEVIRKYLKTAAEKSLLNSWQSIQIKFPELSKLEAGWQLKQTGLIFESIYYQFLDFKTQNPTKHRLQILDIQLSNAIAADLHELQATLEGLALTKHLADLPANHCTPSILANQAKKLEEQFQNISCKIYNLVDIKNLKMGSFLAVAQGSAQEPKFIEIIYNENERIAKPIVLVGKGVTFDAGGISLKPALGMEEMKYDMGGAAAVLGIIKTCAILKLPIKIIGLIPATENLPSGTAIKPGDVVTSMSGTTIEITNTDAEGRLILADALTYAERYDPAMVFDMATLTGAIIIALGSAMSGFMTEDESLAKLIHDASNYTFDKAWRMPLTDDYQDAMESPVADLLNSTGDRAAGSVTAAVFLSKFAKKYPWAHIDIAGTAWISGKKRQATGRPVALMVQLLLDWVKNNVK